MPLYTWECEKCGREEEGFRSIAERHNGPHCHGKMKLLILPTQVFVDMPAYVSPASGKRITTRTERQRDLRETGCRPFEGFEIEKKEAERRKAEADKKLDAKLEDTIRREYHQLPPSTRAALEKGE